MAEENTNRNPVEFQVMVITDEGESSPCQGYDLRFGEVRFLTPNTLVLAHNQSLHLKVISDGLQYEIKDVRVEAVNGVNGLNCYDCEIVRMGSQDLNQHHELLCKRGFPPPTHQAGGERKRVPMSAGAGWPHLRESVMMLNLAVAQIESSMEDGERSVGELTQSFFHLSENLKSVYSELNELDTSGQQDSRKQDILQRMAGLQGHVSQAIMAFQFYDKLSQRLAHISNSLSDMARIVSDVSRVDDTEHWRELKEKIKKSYSIEEEHALFEAILAGEDAHAAIKRIASERAEQAKKQTEEPDIELF